ncbi:hypothetical protein U27_04435 [Candidatus Vecturithrix granuli]|uniref:Uncharacterized protein n=1 Tax=Vecturithrix granuli TaxID=1499967 RepID=A0A081BYR3_VECG1|nr:hypothetical protein U27_04435 [Candidatus Vecturithrix granuli]
MSGSMLIVATVEKIREMLAQVNQANREQIQGALPIIWHVRLKSSNK